MLFIMIMYNLFSKIYTITPTVMLHFCKLILYDQMPYT